MTAGVRRCAGCGAAGNADDRFCETCGARHDDPRDHVELALAGVAGVSDRGHRHHHNEDAFALATLGSSPQRGTVRLAVLCDGVSSVPRPDLASRAAAEAAASSLVSALGSTDPVVDAATAMAMAADAAATAVVELRTTAGLPRASACTFVAAVVTDAVATIGWLGDSRAYWLPASRTPGELLTLDDSWLERTAEAGSMSPEEAAADPRAHSITAWLGAGVAPGDVHLTTWRPTEAGTLVLCTDGLWNYHASPEAIAGALPADVGHDPIDAARVLVDAALRSGGRDNVTVAVLPIEPSPHQTPFTDPAGGTS